MFNHIFVVVVFGHFVTMNLFTNQTFTITNANGANPPNCTTLSFPLGNETNISSSLDLISWNGVPDVNGYRITVNGSESDVNDISDLVVTGISYSFNNNFTPGETVSVTVVPFNNDGDALGCTAETFTISDSGEDVPNCTSLTVPVNGAVNIPVDINLSWNQVANAAGYLLTVQTEGNDVIIPETDVGILTSFDLPENLPYGTVIQVAVTPYNSDEVSVSCTFSQFTTAQETDVPVCTSINLPMAGDTDVPINTTIRWNAVGNVEGYILNIGTSEGGTDIVRDLDVGLATSYELMEDLPYDQEIFVGIIPYNQTSNTANCQSQSFFTISEELQEDDETSYGISPNGDGINDFWVIDGIENTPDNTVSIYNRWGDLVYQVQGYDNASNAFNGTANKKTKLGANNLPSGTYFFKIEVTEANDLKTLQGYVILKR
jgi:gliding motility-associated-like protein